MTEADKNRVTGCGSVGKTIASQTEDQPLESSHHQILIFNCRYLKNENKIIKEAGNVPIFFKKETK